MNEATETSDCNPIDLRETILLIAFFLWMGIVCIVVGISMGIIDGDWMSKIIGLIISTFAILPISVAISLIFRGVDNH